MGCLGEPRREPRRTVVNTTSHPLNCLTECAALLHNHSWIGTWNDRHDEQQGVKWYTRNEVLWLIYHFLYSTPQVYRRQAYLADMYKERVTLSLLALATMALNIALWEWTKGTKKTPALDVRHEFFDGISHQYSTTRHSTLTVNKFTGLE